MPTDPPFVAFDEHDIYNHCCAVRRRNLDRIRSTLDHQCAERAHKLNVGTVETFVARQHPIGVAGKLAIGIAMIGLFLIKRFI